MKKTLASLLSVLSINSMGFAFMPALADQEENAPQTRSQTIEAPQSQVIDGKKYVLDSEQSKDDGQEENTEPGKALKSSARIDKLEASAAQTLLKGGVTYRVPQGTTIKLKLASVPTNGMKLLDKDLNGNYWSARIGQEVTAKTSEDIYVDNSKVIPEGTEFHGRVAEIAAPKRVRRPGSLSIAFDEFTTPDGRTFAFGVQANNTRPSTMKTKAHGTGIVAYHALGGAIVGTLVAYYVCGLHYTIATKGMNLAVGAAGGALIATGFALAKKGEKAHLEPGDDLNMTINTDLLLPAATEAVAKKEPNRREGVSIILTKKPKLVKDGVGGWLMKISCKVHNESDKQLRSSDLFLEDMNGNRDPICSGDNIDNEYLFTVEPHTMENVNLTFEIGYPKMKRQLVWLDRNTRQICYRQKLD